MNIYTIYQKFPTHEDCLAHIEKLRWADEPKCTYCNSANVSQRNVETARRRRWWCNGCKRSFSVTINTIFHATRLPLQKWFLAIAIMVNAKKSVSSHQLGRDLDIPVKTAYSLSQRIRKAMLGTQMPILSWIVEMDETYIGRKPCYPGISKRGRGTNKLPVIGTVECGGKVVAKPLLDRKINAHVLHKFALENTDNANPHLISDDYRGYSKMPVIFNKKHSTVNHTLKQYVNGNIHTNTIEGFWATIKRAHFSQHHHYTKAKAYLYIGEACYKYNNRHGINRKGSEVTINKLMEDMLCIRS